MPCLLHNDYVKNLGASQAHCMEELCEALLVKGPLTKGFYQATRASVKAPLVKHPCICGKGMTEMCVCVCARPKSSLGPCNATL